MRTARNHALWDLDAVSHGTDHVFYRLHGIPRVILAAGGALEETVVALQLCNFIFRIEFDELRILVRRDDEEILTLEQGVQIMVRRAYGRSERRMKECRKECPESRTVIPVTEHAVEGAVEVVDFLELAEVFLEGIVVFIVEIAAASRRKAGSAAHDDAVRIADFLNETINLLIHGKLGRAGQLVGRTASSVNTVIFLEIHLCLHDKIFIKAHGCSPYCCKYYSYIHILQISCYRVNLLL